MKPVGLENALNINKKIRLQLYKPGEVRHSNSNSWNCTIYDWWSSRKWVKYPSSLYVTVKGIISPEVVGDVLRSKTPIQKENAKIMLEKVEQPNNDSVHSEYTEMKKLLDKKNWSKCLFKVCKLPNTVMAELPTFDEGCYCLKFSHSGQYLACSILKDDIYTIIVYCVSNYLDKYSV